MSLQVESMEASLLKLWVLQPWLVFTSKMTKSQDGMIQGFLRQVVDTVSRRNLSTKREQERKYCQKSVHGQQEIKNHEDNSIPLL